MALPMETIRRVQRVELRVCREAWSMLLLLFVNTIFNYLFVFVFGLLVREPLSCRYFVILAVACVRTVGTYKIRRVRGLRSKNLKCCSNFKKQHNNEQTRACCYILLSLSSSTDCTQPEPSTVDSVLSHSSIFLSLFISFNHGTY